MEMEQKGFINSGVPLTSACAQRRWTILMALKSQGLDHVTRDGVIVQAHTQVVEVIEP